MTRHTMKKPLSLLSIKAPKRDAASDNAAIETLVKDILVDVRQRGDEAVRVYSERFDGAKLERFEVSESEKRAALDALDPQTRADTEFAIENVRKFAEAQKATILPLEIEALRHALGANRICR